LLYFTTRKLSVSLCVFVRRAAPCVSPEPPQTAQRPTRALRPLHYKVCEAATGGYLELGVLGERDANRVSIPPSMRRRCRSHSSCDHPRLTTSAHADVMLIYVGYVCRPLGVSETQISAPRPIALLPLQTFGLECLQVLLYLTTAQE
jgi:hypothetical protein